MTIIGVLTLGAIASAVSGVARGIRWLSNIDMALALVLAVFIFVVGPTVFLMNIIPGAITEYFGTLPDMLGANMSEGPTGRSSRSPPRRRSSSRSWTSCPAPASSPPW